MPQEYTLQPSPARRSAKSLTEWGVENTFVPFLTFGSPGDLAVTYSQQGGTYRIQGDLVFLTFYLGTSLFTHSTASGVLKIGQVPKAANTKFWGTVAWEGISKATYTDAAIFIQDGTYISVTMFGSGQSFSAVTAADLPSGGQVRFEGALSYRRALA